MTALLLTVLLSTSPSAHAEAERLARQSITDYNVGDFKSALDEATQAYKLDPRPALLYNLGQVNRALHNWERAEFFYRGYLRGRPDAPNRAAVEKLIEEMQARQTGNPPPTPTTAATPSPGTTTQVPVVIENQPAPQPPTQAPLEAPPAEQRSRTILAAEPGASSQAEAPAPVTKSHVAAYVLGGVAIAAAGFAVAGYVEDYQYTNWVNQEKAKTANAAYTAPPITLKSAQIWTVSAYVLTGIAAAGLVGAIIVW
jgi:tetratricopeptide (TPR) repeat protein